MAKIFVIRTADYYPAIAKGELTYEIPIMRWGTLWIDILLTPDQKAQYSFPIS